MREDRAIRLSVLAFLSGPQHQEAVARAAADPRLRRASLAVLAGSLPQAQEHLAAHDSPDLLIVETDLEGDALAAALDRLADVVRPETRVLLLGHSNDIGLYRRVLALGVSDYLYGEVTPDELVEAVRRIFAGRADDTLGRVTCVLGAAGGVGTSAVAVELADRLAAADGDDEVVLLDMDLGWGVDALALNVVPRQTAADVLQHADRIDDLLVERVLERCGDRLRLLAAPSAIGTRVQPTEESVERLVGVLRQKADHVVIDLPRVWTPWLRGLVGDAAAVVLVAYPDLVNLRNARALVDLMEAEREPGAPVHLVFNRAGLARKAELTAADFEEGAGLRPAATIPFDPAGFAAAMNNGQPLRQAARGSAAGKPLDELARLVAGRGAGTAGGGRFSLKSLFTRTR